MNDDKKVISISLAISIAFNLLLLALYIYSRVYENKVIENIFIGLSILIYIVNFLFYLGNFLYASNTKLTEVEKTIRQQNELSVKMINISILFIVLWISALSAFGWWVFVALEILQLFFSISSTHAVSLKIKEIDLLNENEQQKENK